MAVSTDIMLLSIGADGVLYIETGDPLLLKLDSDFSVLEIPEFRFLFLEKIP